MLGVINRKIIDMLRGRNKSEVCNWRSGWSLEYYLRLCCKSVNNLIVVGFSCTLYICIISVAIIDISAYTYLGHRKCETY